MNDTAEIKLYTERHRHMQAEADSQPCQRDSLGHLVRMVQVRIWQTRAHLE